MRITYYENKFLKNMENVEIYFSNHIESIIVDYVHIYEVKLFNFHLRRISYLLFF